MKTLAQIEKCSEARTLCSVLPASKNSFARTWGQDLLNSSSCAEVLEGQRLKQLGQRVHF